MAHGDGPRRWLVLLLTSLVVAAKNYCFDNPASLELPFRESLKLTETEYNLLYTVYSVPNVLVPLIGGLVIDGLGDTLSFVGFTLCVVVGQGVFAVGATLRSFHVALLGRGIFGLGGECLNVAQSTILAKWFGGGKEMEMAMGIALTATCLGDVLTDWICPVIYGRDWSPIFPPKELSSPLWLGFLVMLLSFWISLIYVAMAVQSQTDLKCAIPTPPAAGGRVHLLAVDVNNHHGAAGPHRVAVDANNRTNKKNDNKPPPPPPFFASLPSPTPPPPPPPPCSFDDHVGNTTAVGIVPLQAADVAGADAISEKTASTIDHLMMPHHHQQSWSADVDVDDDGDDDDVETSDVLVSLLHISSFGPVYWMLNGGCIVIYAAVVAFHGVASGVLMWKWPSLTLESAGLMISVPYLVSALINPLMGWGITRYGRRVVISGTAFFFLSLSHISIAYFPFPPLVPLVTMGVVYSIYAAALWPSVALVIDSSALGTAYGLITSLQNLALVITPIIVGLIKDITHDYGKVERFFAFVSILGFFMCVILNYLDSTNLDGLLNSPPPPPPLLPPPPPVAIAADSSTNTVAAADCMGETGLCRCHVDAADPLSDMRQPLLPPSS